jgi:hypothetical protein
LYHNFLLFESELTVIAPFFDSNSNIKKNDYYKSILEYLKELSILRRSTVVNFDSTQINGTLNIEEYLLLNSDDNQDLFNQLMELRCTPKISQELRVTNFIENNSLKLKEKNVDILNKQLDIFSTLMSTCYQSIFDCNISSYHIEISRRMSLRFLYKFHTAYHFLKEWIIKFSSRDKGTKTATQVKALLIGKDSPYNMFNIKQKNNLFHIEHVIDGNSFKVRKRKRNQVPEEFMDLRVNIPGFSGQISSRKLATFIIAGPRLVELLQALNNNWVVLDIIDDISITYLENFRKDEWSAFIKNIKGY